MKNWLISFELLYLPITRKNKSKFVRFFTSRDGNSMKERPFSQRHLFQYKNKKFFPPFLFFLHR